MWCSFAWYNHSFCEVQVGLLVVLCLILRSRPEVLLLMSPTFLKKGAAYSTPRHLPFQLWILDQAAR